MKYLLCKIKKLLKNLMLFTTSYSLNVFDNPLSAKEEKYYIDRLLDGDKDARNKLIEHNLRLVAHIVKKYESTTVSSDDLISIGTIGLIKGIDSYNKQRGVKLTTYAAKCAENEILMYFRSNKKYNNVISINDIIGHDKDGGDIALIDVLEETSDDISNTLEYKDNIKNRIEQAIRKNLDINTINYFMDKRKKILTKTSRNILIQKITQIIPFFNMLR